MVSRSLLTFFFLFCQERAVCALEVSGALRLRARHLQQGSKFHSFTRQKSCSGLCPGGGWGGLCPWGAVPGEVCMQVGGLHMAWQADPAGSQGSSHWSWASEWPAACRAPQTCGRCPCLSAGPPPCSLGLSGHQAPSGRVTFPSSLHLRLELEPTAAQPQCPHL